MRIPDYEVSAAAKRPFRGLNTIIKDPKAVAPGYAQDAKNWLTAKLGDHIELRRGQALLGKTRNNAGKITGLGVGLRYDSVGVPYRTRGQMVEYYDATEDDWIEQSTNVLANNILGSTANGERTWIEPYLNLAGSFTIIGSPNAGIFKVPNPNPANAVNKLVTDFRFQTLKISQNRAFAGQRNGISPGNNDKTGVYLSYIDPALLSDYTHTSGQNIGHGRRQHQNILNDAHARYLPYDVHVSGCVRCNCCRYERQCNNKSRKRRGHLDGSRPLGARSGDYHWRRWHDTDQRPYRYSSERARRQYRDARHRQHIVQRLHERRHDCEGGAIH
jgi:hypothetical protein